MKKVIKIFLYGILILVVLPLLFVGVVLSYYHIKNSSDPQYISYLNSNKEIIQNENPVFELFDTTFYDHQLFLLGESHGFAIPQKMDFQLLKHLRNKTGGIHYLAEMDLVQAHYINLYLQTGNEGELSRVFKFWKKINAQWANQEFYDKIKAIRKFNLALPPQEKVEVYGIDRIQDVELVKYYLKQSVNDSLAINSSLTALLQDELEKEDADVHVIAQLLSNLEEQLPDESTLKSPNSPNNIDALIANLQLYEKRIRRDSVMYLNFKKLVENNTEAGRKFYGLWGFHHVMQEEVNDHLSFAGLVKKYTDVPLISIGIYAIDSKMMLPTVVIPEGLRPENTAYIESDLINSDGPIVFTEGINDLKKTSRPHTATLYKVNGKGSPYYASTRLANIKSLIGGSLENTNEDAATADHFQYLFLIRNSDALQPLTLAE